MNLNAPYRNMDVVYTKGEPVFEADGLASRGIDCILVKNGDPEDFVVFDRNLDLDYQPNKKEGIGFGFYKTDSRPGDAKPLRVHFAQGTHPSWADNLTEVKL